MAKFLADLQLHWSGMMGVSLYPDDKANVIYQVTYQN
jgi:hypothetical protein